MCENFQRHRTKIIATSVRTDIQRDKQTNRDTNGTDQHTWRFFQIRQVTKYVKCGALGNHSESDTSVKRQI